MAEPVRAQVWGFSVAGIAAALLTAALVLVLGGGAPEPAPPGLPDAAPWVTWGLALAPVLSTVAGVLTVGLSLLAGGHLGHAPAADQSDAASDARSDAKVAAARAAGGWAVVSVLAVVLSALRLRALSPDGSVVVGLLGSVQVQALVVSALLAGAAAVTVRRTPRTGLPLALAALAPTVLAGHVRTAELPVLAAVVLVVHVVAASLWVGGLVALGWSAVRRRDEWATGLPRYSRLALVCVLALAVTGIITALGRLGSLGDLLGTAYGVVVVLKALGLVALAATGWLQRRHVVARGVRGRRDFVLLAGSELILMALIFGLAAGLSQTPPP